MLFLVNETASPLYWIWAAHDEATWWQGYIREDGGGRERGTLLVQVSSESHVHKAMLCTNELSVCVGEVYGLGEERPLGFRGSGDKGTQSSQIWHQNPPILSKT